MTSWKLYYPLATADNQNICRLHFHALRADPHVERLAIGRGPTPFIAEIEVSFVDGHKQPKNRELHALDKRFPPVEVEVLDEIKKAIPLLPPDERKPFMAEEKPVLMSTVNVSFSFDPEKKEMTNYSSEWSPMFEPVPDWVKVNLWVRDKISGRRFEIRRLVLAEPSSIIMHEWRTDEDLMVCVSVGYLMSDFELSEAPLEGATAFARLNAEDPFED